MVSRQGVLVVVQQFLVKLFPRAQACIDDLNILIEGNARKLHHALGKVKYLHRLTHIEHIYLSPLPYGSCFQYKLAGFGYGHKETCYFRMCYGNWATIIYLLAEARYYRTI